MKGSILKQVVEENQGSIVMEIGRCYAIQFGIQLSPQSASAAAAECTDIVSRFAFWLQKKDFLNLVTISKIKILFSNIKI